MSNVTTPQRSKSPNGGSELKSITATPDGSVSTVIGDTNSPPDSFLTRVCDLD